jgi:hypothetical protein
MHIHVVTYVTMFFWIKLKSIIFISVTVGEVTIDISRRAAESSVAHACGRAANYQGATI